jgi:hypothetical protein
MSLFKFIILYSLALLFDREGIKDAEERGHL